MTDRHEDVPAYVVGALNDLERQAFDRHLMGCSTCQAEIEQLRPAVEALSRDVEPMEPPPALKAGLMAVVEREAALRRAPAPARAGTRARLRWRGPALAAALAATLAAAGVGGFAVGRIGADTESIAAQVDDRRLPGATGRLVSAGGAGVLRLAGLPDLPDDQAYAIWVERGGELTAVGLVAPTETGTAQAGIAELDGADGVYVTRQPMDDVRRPSEEPVVSVPLTDS